MRLDRLCKAAPYLFPLRPWDLLEVCTPASGFVLRWGAMRVPAPSDSRGLVLRTL